ncbi:hypothetical protein ACTMS0_14380 [Micromonospora sp. H33]
MTHRVSAIDDDRRIRSVRASAPATGHRAGSVLDAPPAGHPTARR